MIIIYIYVDCILKIPNDFGKSVDNKFFGLNSRGLNFQGNESGDAKKKVEQKKYRRCCRIR